MRHQLRPLAFRVAALDYLAFIDIYHERIKAFHVKDAEFNPTGRQGVYSGFAPGSSAPAVSARSATDKWISPASSPRWRNTVFDAGRCSNGSCLKHPEDGAREGAEFIAHIIRVTEKAFDDFAGGAIDQKKIKRALGLNLKESTPMAIEGRSDGASGARIRLGMVGGGRALHRRGASDRREAGRSIRAGRRRVRDAGEVARPAPARPHAGPHLRTTRHGEGRSPRPDGIQAVTIATPQQYPRRAELRVPGRRRPIICDKPLTVRPGAGPQTGGGVEGGPHLRVTYNNTGYPMARERAMVGRRRAREIRSSRSNMRRTGWPARPRRPATSKPWRVDPALGAGGALGDIGTHAYNLAEFITGLELVELAATSPRSAPGAARRRCAEHAAHANGARGTLWASQVAPGNENGLHAARLRRQGRRPMGAGEPN